MNTGQDWRDQQAPEVVNQNYPEAVPAPNYHHNFLPQQYPQPHQTQGYALSKAEDGTGTYASSNTPYHVPFAAPAAALPGPGEKANNDGKRTGVCGASTVVIVLSAIIAALFVAVVGLAAGTGVEANRANVAEAQVRSMSAAASTVAAKTVTATAAAAAATITSLDALDAGCSTNAAGVSGSTYGAFACEFFSVEEFCDEHAEYSRITYGAVIGGDRSFTLQCNADAVGSPLLKLFASDIHTCMVRSLP